MNRFFAKLDLALLAIIARDVAGIAAVASISFGSWMVYAPAGFIVAGSMILAGIIAAARGDRPTPRHRNRRRSPDNRTGGPRKYAFPPFKI